MGKLRHVALLASAAFFCLSAFLPAFAAVSPEGEPAPRVRSAETRLAQLGDVDVFVDRYGRRILLDSRTGAIVAVEPPRRVPRTVRVRPTGRQKATVPDRQKGKAQGQAGASARLKETPQNPSKAKAPARSTGAATAASRPPPAATIESPEYYDFKPEPLASVDFAGLQRLPELPRDGTAPSGVAGNVQTPTEALASMPLMTFAKSMENGRGAVAAPPAPTASAAPDRAAEGGTGGSLDAGRDVTGSVQGPSRLGGSAESAARSGIGDGKAVRLAAQGGDAQAQFDLGRMYQTGEGVLQDYVFAHMWFNLSAAQGFADAKKARADITDRMTPEQVAEAQKLAREWKPAGENGRSTTLH